LAATLLPYRAVVAGTAIHGHTPGPPDQSKSACQPPTPQDWAEQIKRGTRQSEDEKGRQESVQY